VTTPRCCCRARQRFQHYLRFDQLGSDLVVPAQGRTVTTAKHANHLANELVKSLFQLEKEGKTDLLELLPDVKVTMPNAVMDSVLQHLPMYPLIDDLDCTLFANRTTEDFLTSDHPVAIGNNLPKDAPSRGASGFSSRAHSDAASPLDGVLELDSEGARGSEGGKSCTCARFERRASEASAAHAGRCGRQSRRC
jgi:hypothetical protein